MSILEAVILGIIQGLTEFLPVSSSGHIEICKALLGLHIEDNLLFTGMVHAATVLSTIIVFRKEISRIFVDAFKFRWNESTAYIFKIVVSMIPVAVVGFFFKDQVETIFNSEKILFLVGCMLLITALLLTFTYYIKEKNKPISFLHAFVMGIAQMFAVIPGISRSGTTIATGLLMGGSREKVAQFSFLMVLIPILGENILNLVSGDFHTQTSMKILPLILGFLAAFVAGLFACKWMLTIVRRGKLIHFAIYCSVVGLILIISYLL